jgi:hypothetical protein
MSEPFLFFPKNAEYLSGKTRRPEYGQADFNIGCALFFLVPFVLASMFLVAWVLNTLYENMMLSLDSTVTTGIVRQHYIDYATDSEDSDSFVIVYGFTVDDRPYERRQDVPRELHAQYAVERPIMVRYVPSSPDISRIDGVSTLGLDVFVIVFAVFWVGVTALVIVGYITTRNRLQRLQREGRVLLGEITRLTSDTDSDGDLHIEVELRFRSPGTLQWVAGKRKYMVNHLRGRLLPIQGDAVRVVYADDGVWEVL